MWELDYKESSVPKNWCFWTVGEKTLESPLDSKEIQPANPKGNQSWIFIGKTDAEAETLILHSPDAKNWLICKDPDAGKDWRQEEKGKKEDKMVGWHHQRNGHEFEQAPGVGDGQGSLVGYSPWGHKESDTTEQLNWTELKILQTFITPRVLEGACARERPWDLGIVSFNRYLWHCLGSCYLIHFTVLHKTCNSFCHARG